MADHIDGMNVHLAHCDVTLLVVSLPGRNRALSPAHARRRSS
jgi:predicted dithiol-disulfide oxidoreductase (DUF899 family)